MADKEQKFRVTFVVTVPAGINSINRFPGQDHAARSLSGDDEWDYSLNGECNLPPCRVTDTTVEEIK